VPSCRVVKEVSVPRAFVATTSEADIVDNGVFEALSAPEGIHYSASEHLLLDVLRSAFLGRSNEHSL
jgi:hypothetical protein